MEHDDGRGPTGPGVGVEPVRGGRNDRRAVVAALVACLAIGLAILKPWGSGDSTVRPIPSPSTATASPPAVRALADTPAPTDRATAAGSPAPTPRRLTTEPGGQCALTPGWRVFSVQEAGGRPFQSWDDVTPVKAGDARDPAIPIDRIMTGSVGALGFCAPIDETSDGPPVVRAWDVPGSGDPVALDLRQVAEYAPPDPRLGAVYAPPGGPGGPGGDQTAWAAGTYVFAVASSGADPVPRWFAVRIVAVAPQSSPKARATPAAHLGAPRSGLRVAVVTPT